MLIQNFFSFLASNSARRRSCRWRPLSAQLCLERLEGRRLLTFSPGVNYALDSGPHAVVSADFNEDGRLDLATANSNSTVSVLLGNTDGTFQQAQNFATGFNPLSLAVGDFNEDGELDLATADAVGVCTLLGNGNGTFQAPVDHGFNGSPSSVAVGDFNGDGHLDLAGTSNVYYPPYYSGYPGTYSGYANVLLGTGTGSFAAPVSSYLGYGYHMSATVADFNGDGKHDFATVNNYSSLSVLLGNTAGFGPPTSFATGSSPQAVTVGDFTGDGILDLAAAGILAGNGNGTFQTISQLPGPAALAPADFNADGKLDLVTVGNGSIVSVMLETGDGTFRPPIDVATGAMGVAVGDFNGDGRPDVATANASSRNVSVRFNDGDWPAMDAPAIFINDVTVTEGNTGTVSATFVMSLSAASGQTVSVQYATADGSATVAGSDYQATSGYVIFAPGVTSRTVTVVVNGDRLGEYGESFFVNLSDATNAFVGDATAAGIITDDEPTLSIVGSVSGAEGNIGTTPLHFIVTLSKAYDVAVTVDYATADLTLDEQSYWGLPGATAGVDYTATVGTLTIPAGQVSGRITVPVTGDRVGESYEYFFVNLSNPSGAQLSSSSVALSEIVDDEPSVSIHSGVSTVEGNSGTTAMTFTVSLSTAYDANVTVSYATADGSALAGSDYVAASGAVTIPAGQLSRTLTVLVNGDLLVESDEYFSVNLTSSTTGAIANSLSFATVYDDDTPPTIAISDASIVEGNSGTRLMSFTVSLSKASGKSVWVNYATANSTAKTGDNDYLSKSGTLYFAPGQTTMTFTITIKGDTRKEQNESFYVNLSGASGGTIADRQGVGTIVNDDGLGKGNGKVSSQNLSAAVVDSEIVDLMDDGLGNGTTKVNSRKLSAAAFDPEIVDLMFSGRKKRNR